MESLTHHPVQAWLVRSIICIAACSLIRKLLSLHKTSSNGVKQSRRVSFTTASIAFGTMPDDVNLDNPTMQVLISFSKNNCPSVEDVAEMVEKTFQFPRMACIPKGIFGGEDWVFQPSDKPIDPMRMVRVLEVSCDTVQDLADIVQGESRRRVLRAPHRNLPWWEFILILNKGNGDSMLVLRIDHAVGDGYSVGQICANFITNEDGTPLGSFYPESMKANKQKEDAKLQQSKWKVLPKVIPAMLKVLGLPLVAHDHPTAFAKDVVGKRLRENSGDRMVVVFDSFPQSFVKAIKDKAGVSLNDVLVSALSQAIHEYCTHHKCPILEEHGEMLQSRALMVYGFPNRNDSKDTVIRNGWVPLSLNLGVGITSTAARLKHVFKQTSELKNSPIPHCQLWFQNVVCPWLPTSAFQKAVYDIYSRHNLTCTNVPGPAKKVLVAGKPVVNCRFNVDGHVHPVVSILSYNGQINVLFTADIKSIPDMRILERFYMCALKALGEEMGVEVPRNINRLAEQDDLYYSYTLKRNSTH
mmetsp:Transcript_6708/g.10028  ORF Transcript_6708/g.10028 Transcript_6708/m.10028 type:complete len:526 (-) Transcript_6708:272-1849(-)